MYVPVELGFNHHRKTIRLRKLLDEPLAHAYLIALWEAAMIQAPTGDLSLWSDEDIAEAAGFKGDPQALIVALIESGYMEEPRSLHGWNERGRGGWLNSDRGKAAQRQQIKRQRDSLSRHVTPRHKMSLGKGSVVEVSEEDLKNIHPRPKPARGSRSTSNRSRWKPPEDLPGFCAFWRAHPFPESGRECEKLWRDHQLEIDAEVIVGALNEQLGWQKYRGEGLQYLPRTPRYLRREWWTNPKPKEVDAYVFDAEEGTH